MQQPNEVDMSATRQLHVVVGTWETDPHLAEVRQQMLSRIVDGVRRAPGFVQGYWADSSPFRSHTFIVFSDRSAAEAFEADQPPRERLCGSWRRARQPREPGAGWCEEHGAARSRDGCLRLDRTLVDGTWAEY